LWCRLPIPSLREREWQACTTMGKCDRPAIALEWGVGHLTGVGEGLRVGWKLERGLMGLRGELKRSLRPVGIGEIQNPQNS
jgi:hypothetical protein